MSEQNLMARIGAPAALFLSIQLFTTPTVAQSVYHLDAVRFPCIAKNIRNQVGTSVAAPIQVALTRFDQSTTNRAEACGRTRKLVADYNKRASAGKSVVIKDEQVSCDEFPFASTSEGGIGASALIITNDENSRQGRDLKKFYDANKIKAGDKFVVQVDREGLALSLRRIFTYGIINDNGKTIKIMSSSEVCISRETAAHKFHIPKTIEQYISTSGLDIIELK